MSVTRTTIFSYKRGKTNRYLPILMAPYHEKKMNMASKTNKAVKDLYAMCGSVKCLVLGRLLQTTVAGRATIKKAPKKTGV
jgi:hypothetical protein